MFPNIDFQVLDWRASDLILDSNKSSDESDDEDEKNNKNNKTNRKYTIKSFGIDENGHSVSVTITDFNPYFFVKPKKKAITSEFIEKLKRYILSTLSSYLVGDFVGMSVVTKKEMWGFTNNDQFKYIKIKFKSLMCMRSCAKIIKKTPLSHFDLYESNIEPFIRLLHHKNINPSGWIRLTENNYKDNINMLRTNCTKDVIIHWKHIESLSEKENIAPLNIASFDIECSSSHGDFPLAIKTYEKVTSEFIQYFQYISNVHGMTPSRIIEKIHHILLYLFFSFD